MDVFVDTNNLFLLLDFYYSTRIMVVVFNNLFLDHCMFKWDLGEEK